MGVREIGFCDKNTHTDGSVRGMKGWARIPIMGAECATSADGRYEKHLAVKNTGWKVEVVGAKFYQATLLILRESGSYSMGRKSYSRGAVDGGCGSLTGNGNGVWKAIRLNDWFLAIQVGFQSHVVVSPREIFEIPM